MKLIITTDQFRRLLARDDIGPHYPILFKMKNVSKSDLADLVKLLKKKA